MSLMFHYIIHKHMSTHAHIYLKMSLCYEKLKYIYIECTV